MCPTADATVCRASRSRHIGARCHACQASVRVQHVLGKRGHCEGHGGSSLRDMAGPRLVLGSPSGLHSARHRTGNSQNRRADSPGRWFGQMVREDRHRVVMAGRVIAGASSSAVGRHRQETPPLEALRLPVATPAGTHEPRSANAQRQWPASVPGIDGQSRSQSTVPQPSYCPMCVSQRSSVGQNSLHRRYG